MVEKGESGDTGMHMISWRRARGWGDLSENVNDGDRGWDEVIVYQGGVP